jgi:hypothetical protein
MRSSASARELGEEKSEVIGQSLSQNKIEGQQRGGFSGLHASVVATVITAA